jgi:hypothetical protein
MRKRKLFDWFKLIRAMARATVGQPPAPKVEPISVTGFARDLKREMAELAPREEE